MKHATLIALSEDEAALVAEQAAARISSEILDCPRNPTYRELLVLAAAADATQIARERQQADRLLGEGDEGWPNYLADAEEIVSDVQTLARVLAKLVNLEPLEARR